MTPPPAHTPGAARLAVSTWLLGLSVVAIGLSGCGGGTQADGRELFAANCAVCHGASGEGSEQGPPLTDARYLPDQLSDAEIAASIRDGVPEREFTFGPMPAFPRFDDDQVDAVVEVVRDLQREAGLLEP